MQSHAATEPRSATANDPRDRSLMVTAVVAGFFCFAVCAAMTLQHLRVRTPDLLVSPRIQTLKEQLRAAPSDEQIKQRIRGADLELRRRFFRQLSLTISGSYLLLGGLVIFIIAARQLAQRRSRPYFPQPSPEAAEHAARSHSMARVSVAALGFMVAASALSLALSSNSVLPTSLAEVEKLMNARAPAKAAAQLDIPSADEMKRNWPRFRGPDGNGTAAVTNAPLRWDVKTGAGVIWKTPVPAPGFNSPIAWGDRIFLSGGDAQKREVFCFEARSGKLLWQRAPEISPGNPGPLPEIPEQTGYAASTMATDGRRAYVIFANGDLAAFDFAGKQVWAKNLGVPKNPYGHAASLVSWQGRLLVQLDQGESEAGKSRLYALDGATGNILWQRPRPVPSSWATPIIIEASGKTQIITLGVPWVMAYTVADGSEIWRVEGMGGEVTPSPVFAGGMLFVVSPSEKLMAIRTDGQGDVTKSHRAWTAEDNIPDISSPVSNSELVFTVNTGGLLTCYDAKNGQKQFEHDFDMDCHSSPSLAGSRLYLLGTKGTAIIVEAGRQFKELFRTEMGDTFYASPAFAQDRIYLRGAKTLFCIGAKDDKLARRF